MTSAGRKAIWVAALLGVGWGAAGSLYAQAVTNRVVPLPREAMRPLPSPPVPEPLPPMGHSPVEFFRELLVMSPGERVKALADRPVESRRQILAKVREYLAYRPEQRELRLQVTELRWYLWPLMLHSPTNRAEQLARIPEPQRKLVADRLQEWDQLAPDVQTELRENEATLRYFTELSAASDVQKTNLANSISAPRRKKLEEGVRQLQAMPEEQRRKLLARFDRFFDLTPAEKAKALGSLSEPEQRQIEKTLRQYGQLSPEQRDQCIRSFAKFASLSLEERQQFLKNAEHWKLMTPDERQAWRELVSRLEFQPPMPPMPGGVMPRRPPMPPLATNRN
jgi:hypothetical protein